MMMTITAEEMGKKVKKGGLALLGRMTLTVILGVLVVRMAA
jgi:hypothetical protein